MYYRGADAAILVFDLLEDESLDTVRDWVDGKLAYSVSFGGKTETHSNCDKGTVFDHISSSVSTEPSGGIVLRNCHLGPGRRLNRDDGLKRRGFCTLVFKSRHAPPFVSPASALYNVVF